MVVLKKDCTMALLFIDMSQRIVFNSPKVKEMLALELYLVLSMMQKDTMPD